MKGLFFFFLLILSVKIHLTTVLTKHVFLKIYFLKTITKNIFLKSMFLNHKSYYNIKQINILQKNLNFKFLLDI
jgi:hypothetical protein